LRVSVFQCRKLNLSAAGTAGFPEKENSMILSMICRHCCKAKVTRPRGLCWSCYYQQGVREQYPSTSKYARCGVEDFNRAAPLPVAPTDALPGSPEKVAVLIERARLKQALWHPSDAYCMPGGQPVEVEQAMAG
jgi:hypothetical protein